jgi:hypothetical protein
MHFATLLRLLGRVSVRTSLFRADELGIAAAG